MGASHGRVPVNTHSTSVPGLPSRLWVAHRPSTTAHHRNNQRAHNTPHEAMKSRSHGNRVKVNVTKHNQLEEMVEPAARPHVGEIAILVPRILTHMVKGQWRCPATDRRRPSSCASGVGAVYEDDREEEILKSDAETAKKVTINEASTLLSVVTTLT